MVELTRRREFSSSFIPHPCSSRPSRSRPNALLCWRLVSHGGSRSGFNRDPRTLRWFQPLRFNYARQLTRSVSAMHSSCLVKENDVRANENKISYRRNAARLLCGGSAGSSYRDARSAKFRPVASHGTPWRHNKILHRCDRQRHGRSGDHKRGHRRVF